MKDFFIGALFTIFILEIWEWFVSLGTHIFEFLCTKFAVKTYLLKLEIQQNDKEKEIEEKPPAIGFYNETTEEESYDYEEEDDEDY